MERRVMTMVAIVKMNPSRGLYLRLIVDPSPHNLSLLFTTMEGTKTNRNAYTPRTLNCRRSSNRRRIAAPERRYLDK